MLLESAPALAPAILVVVLGAMLAWVLARAFDPVPARVWAVFALVLGLFLGPELWGGATLLPLDGLRGRVPFTGIEPVEPHANPLHGDVLQLLAPALDQVRDAYARGAWPLWAERAGAGMPLLADPQAQAGQPLALAGLLLPVAAAAGATAALRILVALVFTFLFLRRRGLGELAALAGALAWGCGGFVQLWLQWPLANVGALLPLVLYAGALLDERERRRDLLLWIAALATLLLSGHPEATAYALALAAVLTTARTLARSRGRRGAHLARAAAGAGLALALAAPFLLPALELLPRSVRAEAMRQNAAASMVDVSTSNMAALPGHDAAAAARFSPAARRLLPLVAPNAFGNGRYADPTGVVYWGWSNTNEDASGFVGSAALLLAALALLPRRRSPPGAHRAPQERLFIAVVLLGSAVLAAPPLWLRVLPAAGERLLLPIGFAIAVLAAGELDRWRRGHGNVVALAIALLGLGGLLVWATRAHAHPGHPEALAVLRLGALALQLKAAALTAAALVAGRRFRLAGAGVVAALVFELWRLHAPANPPSPHRLLDAETPVVAFLRDRLGPGQRIAAQSAAFPANEPALFGLADARLYNPSAPLAYDRFIEPLLVTPRGNRPELFQVDAPRLDVLGVRYVVSSRAAPMPSTLRLAFEDDAARVWERPQALPPFFLPLAARATGVEPAVQTSTAPALESRVDILPSARLAADGRWHATLVAPPPAVRRLDPEHWRIGLRLGEARLLASGLFDDGGWTVFADRLPLAAAAANGPFVGAWLPEGTRVADAVYRSASFLRGMLVAAAALALLLAGASAGAAPAAYRASSRRSTA